MWLFSANIRQLFITFVALALIVNHDIAPALFLFAVFCMADIGPFRIFPL